MPREFLVDVNSRLVQANPAARFTVGYTAISVCWHNQPRMGVQALLPAFAPEREGIAQVPTGSCLKRVHLPYPPTAVYGGAGNNDYDILPSP